MPSPNFLKFLPGSIWDITSSSFFGRVGLQDLQSSFGVIEGLALDLSGSGSQSLPPHFLGLKML